MALTVGSRLGHSSDVTALIGEGLQRVVPTP